MARRPTDYLGILTVLSRFDVLHIVVGGVAAVVEGAPITTLDLDIVYEQTPDNIDRLARALESLAARYRDPAGRHLTPDASRLSDTRTNLLLTDLGPLDVLAEIGDGWGYDDLLESSHLRQIGQLQVHVLGLDKVIESKEIANSEKDRAALPVLRRTLALKAAQRDED